jgi:hypothetical protein
VKARDSPHHPPESLKPIVPYAVVGDDTDVSEDALTC